MQIDIQNIPGAVLGWLRLVVCFLALLIVAGALVAHLMTRGFFGAVDPVQLAYLAGAAGLACWGCR